MVPTFAFLSQHETTRAQVFNLPGYHHSVRFLTPLFCNLFCPWLSLCSLDRLSSLTCATTEHFQVRAPVRADRWHKGARILRNRMKSRSKVSRSRTYSGHTQCA